MLNKEEIDQLRNIVRDSRFSIEERRKAFEQLQKEEAALMMADLRDYEAEAILSFDTESMDADKERIYTAILERLQPVAQSEPRLPVSGNRRLIRMMKVAGSIAAVFMMVIALVVLLRKDSPTNETAGVLAVNEDRAAANAAYADFDTLMNRNSAFQTFLLRDGSRVALAPHSYLYYRKDFAYRNKIVHLQGEGRFTVHKNEKMPFSVYVNDIEVRDLGTVFHITSTAAKLNVLLIKGKVLIHALKPSAAIPDIAMVPGQQLDVNRASGKYSLHMTDNPAGRQKDTAVPDFNEMLLTKVLAFENAPVEEVLQSLRNEFHIQITIHNQTKEGLLFTGQFTEYMSLSQILNIISRSYNLTISVHGASVELKANSK